MCHKMCVEKPKPAVYTIVFSPNLEINQKFVNESNNNNNNNNKAIVTTSFDCWKV